MSEWIAFDELDPIGRERDDFRSAVIASTIANVNRKKGASAYKPEQFMAKYGRPEVRKQTPEQMLKIVEMLNEAFGGKDLRKKNGNAGDTRS